MSDRYDARAGSILRRVHEEMTRDSGDRDMIARALRLSAADALDEAAGVLLMHGDAGRTARLDIMERAAALRVAP